MKRIVMFLYFTPFFAISQGIIPYNTHVATTSGNWDDCITWNNPIRIYSSREKIINNGVVVNQNLLNTLSNKISFNGNGKVALNGKITFINSFTQIDSEPIDCNQTGLNNVVDNVIVDFATVPSPPIKSQTGFLGGLGGEKLWLQDSINKLPLRSSISLLKPRVFRQSNRRYYQESFDLTKPSPTLPGRVHMIVGDEWISKITYTNDPTYPHIKYPAPDDKKFIIRPNDIFPRYDTYLNEYFNWGYNNGNPKPGIVWECWNEPDGSSLEPYSVIPRTSCLSNDYNCGDGVIDYWPMQARQNFYEIYNHFYNKLKNSQLASYLAQQNPPKKPLAAGPSIGYFNEAYLKEFFDYCLANDLEVNVVTWHEINYPNRTKPYSILKEHVDYVRKNFKENPVYTALNIQSIEINETITPFDRNNPAGILASIAALETGGVDYACKSCWEGWFNGLIAKHQNPNDADSPIINGAIPVRGSCNDNSLNDLYTVEYTQKSDGSLVKDDSGIPKPNDDINNPNKPKSAWWVYKLYGDGVEKRVKSYNEEGRSVVLASKPSLPTIPYAQVLFGYVKRSKDDIAANYLPDLGIYKIRLNNLSSVSTSAYYKITVNKIPYNDELDSDGYIIRTDNVALTAPVFESQDFFIKDNSDGISYEFYAEKENLYQMTIKSLTKNEYLLQTSLKQEANNVLDDLIIYPNPSNNYITITNKKDTNDKFNYQIIDIAGRIVLVGGSQFNEKINIENLKTGNYIIKIETENGLKVNKKIIKN